MRVVVRKRKNFLITLTNVVSMWQTIISFTGMDVLLLFTASLPILTKSPQNAQMRFFTRSVIGELKFLMVIRSPLPYLAEIRR